MIKLLIFLIISAQAFSAPKEYLYCLGQEEKAIHLTSFNPANKLLNSRIISGSLQLPEYVSLNKKYLNKICKNKHPSSEILRLLLKNTNLFKVNLNKADKQLYAIGLKSIEDFKEESLFIFIDYITKLKTLNRDLNCFKKYFPKLDEVLNDAVYNLEESGAKNLLKSMGDLDSIFKRLRTYPVGLSKC